MKALAAAARRWFVHRSGLSGRLRFEALLLMYHRFGSGVGEHGLAAAHFGEQLDFLDRHFDIGSLAEALAPASGGRPRVAITVDDGYRSFYEYGWPELRARGLTACVFLPTRFIDGGGWMWQDRNIHLLRTAPTAVHRLPWRGEVLDLDLATNRTLMDALLRVYEIGRHLDVDGRLELSDTLARSLGQTLPETPPSFYAPMNWDQVRELQDAGVTFGSHTVNHEILTTCDPSTARREIEDSYTILTERLRRPVAAFAYPNGNCNREIRDLVEQAGYACALTTYPGYWSTRGDLHVVPRLPAPGGGEAVLADRLWCWWHQFGAVPPQLASTSP